MTPEQIAAIKTGDTLYRAEERGGHVFIISYTVTACDDKAFWLRAKGRKSDTPCERPAARWVGLFPFAPTRTEALRFLAGILEAQAARYGAFAQGATKARTQALYLARRFSEVPSRKVDREGGASMSKSHAMIARPDPRGDWCQTYTGGRFYILDPDPADVNILDIARALSLQCRFNGHLLDFYSVAQHSVLVSYLVPRDKALAGLLHDAAEAYLGDVIRPMKNNIPAIAALEEDILAAVFARFGLALPLPEEVVKADNAILAAEARDLVPGPTDAWILPEPPADIRIAGWGSEQAFRVFVSRFLDLHPGPLEKIVPNWPDKAAMLCLGQSMGKIEESLWGARP